MRNRFLLRCTVICMAAVMSFAPVSASAATLLKRGSSGSDVKTVQTSLRDLGYYTYSKITGYYGSMTVTAVKRFQKAKGLYADGIVGKRTLSILKGTAAAKIAAATTDNTAVNQTDNSTVNPNDNSTSVVTLTAVSGSAITTDAVSGSAITVSSEDNSNIVSGALDWYSDVRYIFARGTDAVVTDVATGKSFHVRRTYGTNHADCEPLTKDDTNTIREIWGGFSWERRAVIVKVGDYVIAASMTGMPHAGVDSAQANVYVRNRSDGYGSGVNLDSIKDNGASGVLDIHFLNSRTHTTNVVQKSQQDMVKKAEQYLKEMNL